MARDGTQLVQKKTKTTKSTWTGPWPSLGKKPKEMIEEGGDDSI